MHRRNSSRSIARHNGELLSVEHPTTTLEELFLSIVRDSEARPGRRAVADEPVGPPIRRRTKTTVGAEDGPARMARCAVAIPQSEIRIPKS